MGGVVVPPIWYRVSTLSYMGGIAVPVGFGCSIWLSPVGIEACRAAIRLLLSLAPLFSIGYTPLYGPTGWYNEGG